MVYYLSKFIRKISVETETLRNLLRFDADWDWLPQHQAELGLVTQSPVLIFLCSQSTNEGNTRPEALAAKLEQRLEDEWRPIA